MKKLVSTELTGTALLRDPFLNKGTAFDYTERSLFELHGLLPAKIESLEEQSQRVLIRFRQIHNNLNKFLFLSELHATNITLFYKVLTEHLSEMLPIVYTPTIGEAVKAFNKHLMRHQGLIISINDIDKIDEIFSRFSSDKIDIAVVTDGEGVLGLGDQGIGGLEIAIGKLMVYTACGGINPHRTLPVQLDVGTNNIELLNDPLYPGLKQNRPTDQAYFRFLDAFVEKFHKYFPDTLLHWEDFGKNNARAVLNRYLKIHQSFNDDIQGTGAVALAAVLSGIRKSNLPSHKHRICVFGAGTAGTGIADQISYALARIEDKDIRQIKKRFYLIDRSGLICNNSQNLSAFHTDYAKNRKEISHWKINNSANISLEEVVKSAGITILIGCSTVFKAFNDRILRQMKRNCEKPVILPLSNPTDKAEATPEMIFRATDETALIATGSPFESISSGSKTLRISQCNNALIFPGIAIGMLISKAKVLTPEMLLAASMSLSETYCENDNENTLLPDLTDILGISRSSGMVVARQAITEGLCPEIDSSELESRYNELLWSPVYPSLRRTQQFSVNHY